MATSPAHETTDFRERVRNYDLHRGDVPRDKLLPFLGKWVAFSLDGRRIIASADRLADLEISLRGKDVDPQQVFFEKVKDDANTIEIDSE